MTSRTLGWSGLYLVALVAAGCLPGSSSSSGTTTGSASSSTSSSTGTTSEGSGSKSGSSASKAGSSSEGSGSNSSSSSSQGGGSSGTSSSNQGGSSSSGTVTTTTSSGTVTTTTSSGTVTTTTSSGTVTSTTASSSSGTTTTILSSSTATTTTQGGSSSSSSGGPGACPIADGTWVATTVTCDGQSSITFAEYSTTWTFVISGNGTQGSFIYNATVPFFGAGSTTQSGPISCAEVDLSDGGTAEILTETQSSPTVCDPPNWLPTAGCGGNGGTATWSVDNVSPTEVVLTLVPPDDTTIVTCTASNANQSNPLVVTYVADAGQL